MITQNMKIYESTTVDHTKTKLYLLMDVVKKISSVSLHLAETENK